MYESFIVQDFSLLVKFIVDLDEINIDMQLTEKHKDDYEET